jgi:hypothetical protein
MMKVLKLFLLFAFLFYFSGCRKSSVQLQIFPIPNGDFENWNGFPVLLDWKTNSCPQCTTPLQMYVVQKTNDAYNGQSAALFICNGYNRSQAFNKFFVPLHPITLEGYIKSTISAGDTATIHIDLFSGSTLVDQGNWFETTSNSNYRKLIIPISQLSATADSAAIKITGGAKQNTALYIDKLVFTQ